MVDHRLRETVTEREVPTLRKRKTFVGNDWAGSRLGPRYRMKRRSERVGEGLGLRKKKEEEERRRGGEKKKRRTKSG